jgi:hypothetical protein
MTSAWVTRREERIVGFRRWLSRSHSVVVLVLAVACGSVSASPLFAATHAPAECSAICHGDFGVGDASGLVAASDLLTLDDCCGPLASPGDVSNAIVDTGASRLIPAAELHRVCSHCCRE